MLQNTEDKAAAIATTTTTMASNETTANGTEPTISTHFANATTAENTTMAMAMATAVTTTLELTVAATTTTQEETILLSVSNEGQTLTANNATETANAIVAASASQSALALSAVPENPVLAETADANDAPPAMSPTTTTTSGTASASAVEPQLSHVASEPAFGVQMRTQQQQKIKSYHDAKQTTVWRTDSLASNPNPIICFNKCTAESTVMRSTIRAPSIATAPCLLQRKSSDSSIISSNMPRRVSFPESDKELVTGYLEPANPWEQACQVTSIDEISEQYEKSCRKHHTSPMQNIVDHLKSLDLQQARQALLSLKAIQLTPNDCEPLEEIFKRIQYKAIDLSECLLDESCLSALCQMIEYYEAANELDISYNKEEMSYRMWLICTYMIKRSQELQSLNAEGNQISKLGAESLGEALSTSNLHTLKLEHCGLKGPPLTSLCCKLYHNKVLKELWVGYNDLDCTDAQHIADMLRFNHSIELIDISNNNIRNEGAKYLVQALILQSTELERRSGAPLQRHKAIEDDECVSPLSSTPPMELKSIAPISQMPELQEEPNDVALLSSLLGNGDGDKADVDVIKPQASEQSGLSELSVVAAATTTALPLEPAETDVDDDNTEDTVRPVKGNNSQGPTGQSMLDKLLSMNSDSSSDEAPSNISTDTLAACGSEDISETSNEIFDTSTKAIAIAAAMLTTNTLVSPVICTTAVSSPPAKIVVTQLEQLEPTQQKQQQQQQQHQSSQSERNLCDITPSTEAKTVEPNETCTQSNNNASNALNNNNSNNNLTTAAAKTDADAVAPTISVDGIYEVTAEESDCINGAVASGSSRPLDVNKNAKIVDDFEDTHSTDSAFESASEGDISRHLPDEFSRLSVSLESTRLDDMAKELTIETATIATESTECLVAEEAVTPSSTPTPSVLKTVTAARDANADEVFAAPKVTIAADYLGTAKDHERSPNSCMSPTPTPPPPSTSPGGVSSALRRTESSCAYLNQSTRNRSQSSDSLCSDNSLDGSSSCDHQFAEKLTKNDTLSRRHLVDASADLANRAPSGLKALTLWNNNLTKDCASSIGELLQKTVSLELLNIGKNCLSNDFVSTIKDSLTKNTTLTTLGLQSAHLSAKGIETLASILSFGGNSKLQRIDIRDNKIEVESLNIIADVLTSNNTITQIDINDEPKRLTLPIVPIINIIPPTPLPQDSIGSDAHLDYTRVLGTVRSMCSRNERLQAQELAERTANVGAGSSCSSNFNRCRGGYYLGSRKISLTCHSRPLVDAETGTVTTKLAVTVLPTPAAKLEVRRKTNARLRSPGPSPPTISPSSSPNRSRFHVSRVTEVSPLTSPLAQMPPQHPPTPRSASSCMSIPTATSPGSYGLLGSQSSLNVSTTLPTSSSLPAMASVISSTKTIKALSASPRSRFQVSRIYEDPKVPLAVRQMPPITPQTPPINLPPTPMMKSARRATQLSEAIEAASATAASAAMVAPHTPTTTILNTAVLIVEPTDAAPEACGKAHTLPANQAEKLQPHTTASPTSTSSCSTSPVSLTSNSNTSPSMSSSSSNSANTNDVTDSFDSDGTAPAHAVPKTCPIAVFGDNDITLTKESAACVVLSAAAAVNPSQPAIATVPAETLSVHAPRTRKNSWIANPSAVDKLMTLFNTGTIFQRSSSPEPKLNPVAAVAATTNNAQTAAKTTPSCGDSAPNSRKTTPPSWTLNQNLNSNAVLPDTGAGSSLLDAATRQLRDIKQVFRQNLLFNSSGDAAGTLQESAAITSSSASISTVADVSLSTVECNAVHIPFMLKRELKENISPEHTINEETLHTLQKLTRVEDATLKAEAAADLDDIEIVMHSELDDCPEEGQQHEEAAATHV